MTKKQNTPKAFRFTITESANSVTSAVDAVKSVVDALTNLGNSVDENVEALTLKQLKAVYLGKGQAEGCAAVFKAVFESEEYSVKRFAPKIKDFAVRCGLSLNGVVPKSLKLPEGVPQEPTEEGWAVFEAWIKENVPFNPAKVETTEERSERIKKEREDKEKQWAGKAGHDMAILSLLRLSKSVKKYNEKYAKVIRLMACNYDAMERTLKNMAAEKELNRKIPDGIDFKE